MKLNISKYINRICLLALVLFVGTCIMPLQANAAEQTLRVSPVIINLSLSPGKTHTHEVTIENMTSSPLPLRATLNDFITSGEEGGYIFEESKTNPLLSWITLNENEFILGPKEKKTLQMTIHTPKSIPVGGYYGVLFFEPVLMGAPTESTRVNAKVGILMLANIGVIDPNARRAEILDFSLPSFNQESTVPVLLRVKNIALNFFSAKPTITIQPLIPYSGRQTIELEEKIIFPSNVRRWTEESRVKDLSPNIYKANLSVSTGNGQTITSEKYFVVFPFAQAFGVIAVILILLFLFTRRKRVVEAIRALIRP